MIERDKVRGLKYLIIAGAILTFLGLVSSSKTFAQLSTFSGSGGYGYPGSFYEGYPGYGYPGNFYGPGYEPSYYGTYPSMPSGLMNILLVSSYDASDSRIRGIVRDFVTNTYIQPAIMSGWTPWRSSSYYPGYTAPGGYTPFTSIPYYSSLSGPFSSYYPKFIPTSSWPFGLAPYPTSSYSSSKTDITAQSSILTRQNFIIIRNFILKNGTRKTYSNMYNNNPYYEFSDELEAFLNPSSQKYSDCDAPAWEFTELVFRTSTDAPFKYYHIRLGSNSLIIRDEEESESELEYCFSEALQHIHSFN